MTVSKPDDNFDPEGQVVPKRQPLLTPFKFKKPIPDQLGGIETSAQLETSVPLEAPRRVYWIPLQQSAPSSPIDSTASVQHRPAVDDRAELPAKLQAEPQIDFRPQVAEAVVPLLEERLVVDRHKRKIGEVVVRKEIETQIVEVQVRREKLIVEQVSPEYQQLAVVDLGQTQGHGINVPESALPATMEAKFTSVQAAIEFLEALAEESNLGPQEVQVSIALNPSNL